MAGNMDNALALAQSICWDEGYGYRLGGHAASHSDGVDCGGLVFHCLNQAGYSVSDTSPGVSNMPSILTGIGFVGTQYSGNVNDLRHGDIITMVHYSGGQVVAGHTCFICQNILAYTDYAANSDNTAIIPICKVEASSDRGHSGQGDSRKNGTGAYWEVWCHAFYNVYDTGTYDPSDVYVWRDPNYSPNDDIGAAFGALVAGVMAGAILPFIYRKRRKNKWL